MPDSVLLIGAGGFIGRALDEALSAAGNTVLRVTSDAFRSAGGDAVGDDAWYGYDQLEALLARAHKVVYLAARSTPASSAGRALAELDDNLRPLLTLLEALQARPLPLLYFSSAGSLYGDLSTQPFTELDPLLPRSYHGAAKAAAEQFIGAWVRQNAASATILRPSNVYGPGQPERDNFGIIPRAMGMLQRGEMLPVWGDGSTVRDYLYIDDLVALTKSILAAPAEPGLRVFNAASGEPVSLRDLFALLEQAAGRQLRCTYHPSRSVDARQVAVDASRAQRAFNWLPRVSLAQGLERTWLQFPRNRE